MGNPIERYLSEALAASPASSTIGGQEREVRSLGKFIFDTHFIFPFLCFVPDTSVPRPWAGGAVHVGQSEIFGV